MGGVGQGVGGWDRVGMGGMIWGWSKRAEWWVETNR